MLCVWFSRSRGETALNLKVKPPVHLLLLVCLLTCLQDLQHSDTCLDCCPFHSLSWMTPAHPRTVHKHTSACVHLLEVKQGAGNHGARPYIADGMVGEADRPGSLLKTWWRCGLPIQEGFPMRPLAELVLWRISDLVSRTSESSLALFLPCEVTGRKWPSLTRKLTLPTPNPPAP